MKSKLAAGLLAAIGLPALVVSALAQSPLLPQANQPGQNYGVISSQPPGGSAISHTPPTTPGTFHVFDFNFAQNQPAVTAEETKLSIESDALARQLGEAKSDADKEKLKAKLVENLEKQFDLKRKRQEAEVEALENQVKKLKDMVRVRGENRRQIISDRLEQILRDAQGLGW